MAASGAGLFHDDVAVDVRNEYLDLLANGVSDQEAFTTLVAEWKDSIEDPDDGPVFWLALAATQWEHGRLHPRVKARALKVIDQRQDEDRWAGSGVQKKRQAVLARLREKLLLPPPKKRVPRLRTITAPPSFSVASPDQSAQATAWLTGTCPVSGLPISQVYVIMKLKRTEGGGSVFVASCALTDIKLKWVDADTLRISYPKDAKVNQRHTTSFFRSRTIGIEYRLFES